MNIFICEDVDSQLNFISKTIEDAILIENYNMSVVLKTKNPFEIIEALKNNRHTSIYFLDVNLNTSITGIDLAKKIREYDSSGFIIFISTHDEYMATIVKTRTEIFDFIVKSNTENVRKEIVENLKLINGTICNCISKRFSIKVNDKTIIEDFDNIIYFKTGEGSHRIEMVSIFQKQIFRSSIKFIENELDNNFIKVNSSVLVNKQYIISIDFDLWHVKMKNGTIFDISKSVRSSMKNLSF